MEQDAAARCLRAIALPSPLPGIEHREDPVGNLDRLLHGLDPPPNPHFGVTVRSWRSRRESRGPQGRRLWASPANLDCAWHTALAEREPRQLGYEPPQPPDDRCRRRGSESYPGQSRDARICAVGRRAGHRVASLYRHAGRDRGGRGIVGLGRRCLAPAAGEARTCA